VLLSVMASVNVLNFFTIGALRSETKPKSCGACRKLLINPKASGPCHRKFRHDQPVLWAFHCDVSISAGRSKPPKYNGKTTKINAKHRLPP